MKQIIFFNKALRQLDDHLFELPHLCRLLMHCLFKHCDFKTGRITNITMEQMQRDLYVAPASGRKRQKVTADTIRGAFRTIQKFKPKEFIFSVEKQRIVIELPFIRDLFADFDAQNKEATVKAGEGESEETQASSCEKSEIPTVSTAAKIADLTSTAELNTPVKKFNINNINNNNNKALSKKQPITDSFTPSSETIEQALSLGYHDVHKPEVIADFIAKNKAWGSAFADYQPVYLNFLMRRAERLQRNNQQPSSSGRDLHADRRQPSKARPLTASERVIRAYADEFDYCERTGQFFEKGYLAQSINRCVMEATL